MSDGQDAGVDVQRVGVVGCGLIGSGIAEVCIRAGLDVVVFEPNEGALSAGQARTQASLERAHARGKLTEQQFAEL